MNWYWFLADAKCQEHIQNAIDELEDALYQAKLNYHSGEKEIKKIESAISILRGEK